MTNFPTWRFGELRAALASRLLAVQFLQSEASKRGKPPTNAKMLEHHGAGKSLPISSWLELVQTSFGVDEALGIVEDDGTRAAFRNVNFLHFAAAAPLPSLALAHFHELRVQLDLLRSTPRFFVAHVAVTAGEVKYRTRI